jgi:hypothetical protein
MALADFLDSLGPAPVERGEMSASAAFDRLAFCGSVIAFALLIERAGFPIAVLIASVGTRQLTRRQALRLAVIHSTFDLWIAALFASAATCCVRAASNPRRFSWGSCSVSRSETTSIARSLFRTVICPRS